MTTWARAGGGAESNYTFLTQKERDTETGLDFFGARYYSSTQGRFTSADPASIKLKHLLDPRDLNRYAYVSNNPLRYVDPTGEEKIEIILRTYIPYPTITYPPMIGPTFNGNVDGKGQRLSGEEGFKTEQRITIETDEKKSVLIYGQPQATVGRSHRLARGVGNIIGPSEATASGKTLTETARRDSYNTVTAMFTGNEANPLVPADISPGISYHLNVSVSSIGPDIAASVRITGTHDGFPAYEVVIVRPEAGNQTVIKIHDPRDTGDTPAALGPPEERSVDRVVLVDPRKKP